MLSFTLFLWAFAGLVTGLANLRPRGDPGTPEEWNDGRMAQMAWAASREAPRHIDPNAATSVPPPGG